MALCVGICSPAHVSAGAFSYRGGGCQASRLRVLCAVQSREENVRSTMKALKSQNHRPKKWLGQHYMVNEQVNIDMVKAAEIQPGDLVLEIGPGTGSLTNALVDAGANIIAVEKDPGMAVLVGERFGHTGQVEVIKEDFVKWPVVSYMQQALEKRSEASDPPRRAKVIANLPFNITTQVVKQLLPLGSTFSHIILLLQDEAAIRLVDASPDCEEYRPISLLINFFSVPEYKFRVERDNFFPQPNVDAGVVSFALKQESEYPRVSSTKSFFTLVNSAFNGKRKMLRKSLQHLHTPATTQAALTSIGLLGTARPEELTLDQFVSLHNALTQQTTTN
ncbi:hypothetical protein M758_4G202000 [Ceratodon purpureus]|nr:hypothetical protein M758_4G202000 [Ceratodon purpureus]